MMQDVTKFYNACKVWMAKEIISPQCQHTTNEAHPSFWALCQSWHGYVGSTPAHHQWAQIHSHCHWLNHKMGEIAIPWSLRCNGLTERFTPTLCTQLEKNGNYDKRWHKLLHEILFAIGPRYIQAPTILFTVRVAFIVISLLYPFT